MPPTFFAKKARARFRDVSPSPSPLVRSRADAQTRTARPRVRGWSAPSALAGGPTTRPTPRTYDWGSRRSTCGWRRRSSWTRCSPRWWPRAHRAPRRCTPGSARWRPRCPTSGASTSAGRSPRTSPCWWRWRASRSRARRWRTPCTTTPSSWRWRARSPPRRTRTRRGALRVRARRVAPVQLRVLDALKFDLTVRPARRAAGGAAGRGALSGEGAPRRREGAETSRRRLEREGEKTRRRRRRRRRTLFRRVGRLERFFVTPTCVSVSKPRSPRSPWRASSSTSSPGDGVPDGGAAAPAPPLTSGGYVALAARGGASRGVRGKRRLEGARCPRRGAEGRRGVAREAADARGAPRAGGADRRGGEASGETLNVERFYFQK